MSPEEDEPEVTCPVCGNSVTLEDEFCPHCGAEFEEEEIEEIIEIEGYPEDEDALTEFEEYEVEEYAEKEPTEDELELTLDEELFEEEPAEEEPTEDELELTLDEELFEEEPAEEEPYVEYYEEIYEEPVEEEPYEELYEDEFEYEEPAVEEVVEAKAAPATLGILDIRVIGIALLILGVIGAQIALFIHWYWEWVPPIENNLGMFSLIGIAIIVVGFLGFSMIKKSASEGKKVSPKMPSILLGIFLFGIIALVMILANGPINDAMGSANIGMAAVFGVLLLVGIFMYMTGQKRTMPAC